MGFFFFFFLLYSWNWQNLGLSAIVNHFWTVSNDVPIFHVCWLAIGIVDIQLQCYYQRQRDVTRNVIAIKGLIGIGRALVSCSRLVLNQLSIFIKIERKRGCSSSYSITMSSIMDWQRLPNCDKWSSVAVKQTQCLAEHNEKINNSYTNW